MSTLSRFFFSVKSHKPSDVRLLTLVLVRIAACPDGAQRREQQERGASC